MGGKLGTEAIRLQMSTGKLAVISFLQAVSKDGFQGSDLLAPLNSPTFQAAVVSSVDNFVKAVQETKELDFGDNAAIVNHAWNCGKDIWTEAKIALKTIQARV